MTVINSNAIRSLTAGSRSKSKLSRNKRRRKPVDEKNKKTLIKVDNRHAKLQKYFNADKGKIAKANAQQAYLSTDEGRRLKALSQKNLSKC